MMKSIVRTKCQKKVSCKKMNNNTCSVRQMEKKKNVKTRYRKATINNSTHISDTQKKRNKIDSNTTKESVEEKLEQRKRNGRKKLD